MTATNKKRLLDRCIYDLMIEQKNQKILFQCHICENEADIPDDHQMHIEGTDVEIGYPLCENCYDNLRYKIDEKWDDD